jgi:hypothetical protein
VELAKTYRTVGLEDLDNIGQGNCLLYAAMGINGRDAKHPHLVLAIAIAGTCPGGLVSGMHH